MRPQEDYVLAERQKYMCPTGRRTEVNGDEADRREEAREERIHILGGRRKGTDRSESARRNRDESGTS